MMRFQQFIVEEVQINEGKFPLWLRFSVAGIVVKIRHLQSKIENEGDPVEQNKLIAKQNALLSYIGGLSIATNTLDTILLNRLKGTNLGNRK